MLINTWILVGSIIIRDTNYHQLEKSLIPGWIVMGSTIYIICQLLQDFLQVACGAPEASRMCPSEVCPER